MAAFNIQVGDNQYEMEFTRDSVRKFEQMGLSLTDVQGKIYSTADALFTLGLQTHNPSINPNLARKICDAAITEFGIEEVYETVIEPFMEVFTQAGNKPAGKSLRTSPKATLAE